MKITKSELKSMIREVLKEELANVSLKEATNTDDHGTILTWDKQIDFKRYYQKHIGEKNPQFYFDGVSCIDKNTSKSIPGVDASGKYTYGHAAQVIRNHFK